MWQICSSRKLSYIFSFMLYVTCLQNFFNKNKYFDKVGYLFFHDELYLLLHKSAILSTMLISHYNSICCKIKFNYHNWSTGCSWISKCTKTFNRFFYRQLKEFHEPNRFCKMIITTHSPGIMQAVKLEDIQQIFVSKDGRNQGRIEGRGGGGGCLSLWNVCMLYPKYLCAMMYISFLKRNAMTFWP
jgi:hypothetical protein